jgi:hypothetical protein
MTLSHYQNFETTGMEIIVDYNPTMKQVEDVINIIATDITDRAEVDIAPVLYHKFPSIIKYLVDSIDWEKEYKGYLQHSLTTLKK